MTEPLRRPACRIDDPRVEHVARRISDPAWHLLSKNSRRNWLLTAAAAIAALQEYDAR